MGRPTRGPARPLRKRLKAWAAQCLSESDAGCAPLLHQKLVLAFCGSRETRSPWACSYGTPGANAEHGRTLHRSCGTTAGLLVVQPDLLRSIQRQDIRAASFTAVLGQVGRI